MGSKLPQMELYGNGKLEYCSQDLYWWDPLTIGTTVCSPMLGKPFLMSPTTAISGS